MCIHDINEMNSVEHFALYNVSYYNLIKNLLRRKSWKRFYVEVLSWKISYQRISNDQHLQIEMHKFFKQRNLLSLPMKFLSKASEIRVPSFESFFDCFNSKSIFSQTIMYQVKQTLPSLRLELQLSTIVKPQVRNSSGTNKCK